MGMVCSLILKLWGWQIIGVLPDNKKYLLIVAPHTSNWDLVVGLLARFSLKTKINFLAKKEIFIVPFGSLLTAIGGIPVDRKKKGNTVEETVCLFNTHDRLILAITPEGTRGPVTRWKEGFYHIASQAHIPIVMIGFDYASKEIRIQKPFIPTGSIANDFPQFVKYFRSIKGRRPKTIPDYHPKE